MHLVSAWKELTSGSSGPYESTMSKSRPFLVNWFLARSIDSRAFLNLCGRGGPRRREAIPVCVLVFLYVRLHSTMVGHVARFVHIDVLLVEGCISFLWKLKELVSRYQLDNLAENAVTQCLHLVPNRQGKMEKETEDSRKAHAKMVQFARAIWNID